MAIRKTRGSTAKKLATFSLTNSLPANANITVASDDKIDADPVKSYVTKSNTEPKSKVECKPELDPNALPHGLSVQTVSTQSEFVPKTKNTLPDSKQTTKPRQARNTNKPAANKEKTVVEGDSVNQPRARKLLNYGVTLGVSPFPARIEPTPQAARLVNAVLTELHGKVNAPEDIPVPSRNVAGCGEVKFILEAMIRTLLSANTTMSNANRAIQGVIARYGTINEGLSAGSIDWMSVKRGSQKDLENAIMSGGTQVVKSKHIKAILDIVYEENQERRAALKAKIDSDGIPAGGTFSNRIEEIVTGEKADEVVSDKEAQRASIMARYAESVLSEDSNILTLDYLFALKSDNEIFQALLQYPGIGVKTSACILLFCIQRPCFAIDTHVWRLCIWLGWVPPNANRNLAFGHCDVRVPDEDGLKYSLHQLMIIHGKNCYRCQASTSTKSKGWADSVCPLETIPTFKRLGVKKGGEAIGPESKKRKSKGAEKEEESEVDIDEGVQSSEVEEVNDKTGRTMPIRKMAKSTPAAKVQVIKNNAAKGTRPAKKATAPNPKSAAPAAKNAAAQSAAKRRATRRAGIGSDAAM